eukprot:218836-Amphidinium_carterae.2
MLRMGLAVESFMLHENSLMGPLPSAFSGGPASRLNLIPCHAIVAVHHASGSKSLTEQQPLNETGRRNQWCKRLVSQKDGLTETSCVALAGTFPWIPRLARSASTRNSDESTFGSTA